MAIALKTWQKAREDYISGGGSLRTIAWKHGLNPNTVQRRAKCQQWHRLRQERDEALRTGQPPPTFPRAYTPPAPASEPLSESWLDAKRHAHFREILGLIETVRGQLKQKLNAGGLDCDELARCVNILGTLAEIEARLLGIRDTRKDKPRPRRPARLFDFPSPEPTPESEPSPVTEPPPATEPPPGIIGPVLAPGWMLVTPGSNDGQNLSEPAADSTGPAAPKSASKNKVVSVGKLVLNSGATNSKRNGG